MTSLELATEVKKALDSKKAEDIKVLKVSELTVIADYFVIATGTSITQVKALADEVEYRLEQQGVRPLHRQGLETANWVAVDFGSVIVHIFYPQMREFYALEKLWGDAEEIEIPD